jgi:hypothetical protein
VNAVDDGQSPSSIPISNRTASSAPNGISPSKARSLYWLSYQISVVMEPAPPSFLPALRAALHNLDEGEFTVGHELDGKLTKQVPKAMIGRRLSQEEAKKFLAKFD